MAPPFRAVRSSTQTTQGRLIQQPKVGISHRPRAEARCHSLRLRQPKRNTAPTRHDVSNLPSKSVRRAAMRICQSVKPSYRSTYGGRRAHRLIALVVDALALRLAKGSGVQEFALLGTDLVDRVGDAVLVGPGIAANAGDLSGEWGAGWGDHRRATGEGSSTSAGSSRTGKWFVPFSFGWP